MSLLDELTNDPEGLGYAPHIATGDDGIIYGLLTDKVFTKPGWVGVPNFNAWCAANNDEYLNIEAHASNSASPFYAAAKTLLRMLNGAVSDGAFDLANPAISGLFNVWPFVDQTGQTKAALIAAGTYPASRAEILGIPVSVELIAKALRG